MTTYIINIKIDGESKRALVSVKDENKPIAKFLKEWEDTQSEAIEMVLI